MTEQRDTVVLSDRAAETGGRRVTYLLASNERVTVWFSSPEYSAAAVEDVARALERADRRPPKGSRTNQQRRADG